MVAFEWSVGQPNVYPFNNWIKEIPQCGQFQNFYVRDLGWQFNQKRESKIEDRS